MKTRGERLKEYIQYKKLGLKEFGDSLGAPKATVNHWMNNQSLTIEWLTRICNEYTDLNLYWLLSGEESMLKGDVEIKSQEIMTTEEKIKILEEKVSMLEEINTLLKEKINHLK